MHTFLFRVDLLGHRGHTQFILTESSRLGIFNSFLYFIKWNGVILLFICISIVSKVMKLRPFSYVYSACAWLLL